jgi:hypothetical protein
VSGPVSDEKEDPKQQGCSGRIGIPRCECTQKEYNEDQMYYEGCVSCSSCISPAQLQTMSRKTHLGHHYYVCLECYLTKGLEYCGMCPETMKVPNYATKDATIKIGGVSIKLCTVCAASTGKPGLKDIPLNRQLRDTMKTDCSFWKRVRKSGVIPTLEEYAKAMPGICGKGVREVRSIYEKEVNRMKSEACRLFIRCHINTTCSLKPLMTEVSGVSGLGSDCADIVISYIIPPPSSHTSLIKKAASVNGGICSHCGTYHSLTKKQRRRGGGTICRHCTLKAYNAKPRDCTDCGRNIVELGGTSRWVWNCERERYDDRIKPLPVAYRQCVDCVRLRLVKEHKCYNWMIARQVRSIGLLVLGPPPLPPIPSSISWGTSKTFRRSIDRRRKVRLGWWLSVYHTTILEIDILRCSTWEIKAYTKTIRAKVISICAAVNLARSVSGLIESIGRYEFAMGLKEVKWRFGLAAINRGRE